MATPIITLQVGSKELKFAPTMVAYNSLVNSMRPGDMVAPTHNYLKKIVCQESQADLDELLAKPGAVMQLAAAVNGEFVPELEITVKN
ncbi:MAG: putative phage tail assembly chaperone [Caldilineaceae bacterium]